MNVTEKQNVILGRAGVTKEALDFFLEYSLVSILIGWCLGNVKKDCDPRERYETNNPGLVAWFDHYEIGFGSGKKKKDSLPAPPAKKELPASPVQSDLGVPPLAEKVTEVKKSKKKNKKKKNKKKNKVAAVVPTKTDYEKLIALSGVGEKLADRVVSLEERSYENMVALSGVGDVLACRMLEVLN